MTMYYGRPTTSILSFTITGIAEAKRKFGAVMTGLPEARLREMRWLIREGLQYLREEAPERTGALKRGFRGVTLEHTPTLTRIGLFATDEGFAGGGDGPSRYVRWVLEGRGPVEAKPGKMLRFEPGPPGSGFIYRKRVGPAKANPFDVRTTRRLSEHPIMVARNIGVRVNRDFS